MSIEEKKRKVKKIIPFQAGFIPFAGGRVKELRQNADVKKKAVCGRKRGLG